MTSDSGERPVKVKGREIWFEVEWLVNYLPGEESFVVCMVWGAKKWGLQA